MKHPDARRAARAAIARILFGLVAAAFLPACYGSGVGLGRDGDDDEDCDGDEDCEEADCLDSDCAEQDCEDDECDQWADDDDDSPDDDDGSPADDDDTTSKKSFEIDELDPDHGSTEGGYDLDIRFEGSLAETDESEITVFIGTREAEVIALASDRIVVEVPPGCAPGDVDVEVEIEDEGSDSASFEYETWAEDRDGAIFGLFKSESPAYPGSESGAAELGFFEPEDSPPLTHLPPLGTCSYNVVPPDNTRQYYPVGAQLSVSAGSPFSVTLDASSDTYTAAPIPATQVPNSASYSVLGAEDPDECPMELASVVSAPPALVVQYPDITSQEFADCWYMSGVAPIGDVEWLGPYDSGDYVFVQLVNAETAGAPSVTCHGQDNGAFLLEQADMIGLQPGLHVISVTRYRVIETPLERSGATAYGVFADTQTGYVFVLLTDSECGF